ncbi:hypothetical protein [Streptomyces sp. NPDC056632]|uniref:hypothetical protein n=1 Tax=Streptomyces sp. NPDC056632 TaxID=3345884 RepID=UPI003696759D
MEETGPPYDRRENLNFPLALSTHEILLGVPAKDHQMFPKWVDMFFHGGGDHTADDIAAGRAHLWTYMEGLAQDKRRQPGDDTTAR